jgi:signal transduction histidine kinase
MKPLLNSITKRLFFSFGFLLLNIFIVAVLSVYVLWKTNSLNTLTNQIDQQRILVLQILKTDLEFLRFESINSDFYLTGESVFLQKRDSLASQLKDQQHELFASFEKNDFELSTELSKFDSTLFHYNKTFCLLTARIRIRGFKDYGVEGAMRQHAHVLENDTPTLRLADILMLRRHEKDFLLRKEALYIQKFNDLVDHLLAEQRNAHNNKTIEALLSYQKLFNKLTELYFSIGVSPSEGYEGKLNVKSLEISQQLEVLARLTRERKEAIVRLGIILFVVITVTLILISVFFTYYTSTRLARPIKKLSLSMNKFMVNERLSEYDLENAAPDADEISNLSQSFIKLSRKLKAQFQEILQQNMELKKLNDELDRFIYSAAHDLKSPLASLDGLIHLAEKEVNSPEHTHYFKMMAGSVNKLHSFIRDITDYAKNKRQTLRVEKVDIALLVEEIIQNVKFLPHAEKLRVIVSINGDTFYTDKTRLEIVLKNLITNSFKYLDISKSNSYLKIDGTIDKSAMRLTIIDNGIGIAQQHTSKIFDMFYRAVEHSNGTGIGLFLVKESVKMLRGRISVKSKLGEWTMFHLYLPNISQSLHNSPETEGVVLEEAV